MYKQLMLDVIRRRPTQRIPWVPRLDLWYRAHKLAGTLPARFASATLQEIVDELGWGYHAVVPNFKAVNSAEDEAHRALGIYNLPAMPFRTEFDVEWSMEQAGDRTIVRYRTPKGELTTRTAYTDSMRRAGITITHVEEHVFKGPEDYDALCWLFEHAQALPNPQGYEQFAEQVGQRGFATAYLSSSASPMHLIQRELMPMETFFFEMNDRPEQLERLCRAIDGYWQQMLTICADSAADVFLLGANYDSAIQSPPFFARHIVPGLRQFADMLHQKGKFLLTHTDGENNGLLEHYVAAGFDIADSICPAPMTRLTFGHIRQALGEGITIMGGIPSVALIPQSMDDRSFERFLDQFFEQIGDGRRLILGISDTTPPGATFDRLLRIAQRVEQFGRPGSAE